MTKTPDDRIPVIVGVGEITDKPANPEQGLEPLALMQEALKRAEADAGAKLLGAIDSIDLVNLVSWRYEDPAKQLCERLGIQPPRAVYGPVGGEAPIRYLHEAALRIQRGESVVAAICGAEAQYTVNKAAKANVKLPWTPYAEHGVASVRNVSYQHPMARALGVAQPITVYPFYDAATAVQWGQTPREALQESSELWSTFSRVAATNPYSWIKRAVDAEAIMTPTADNRLIAWPYNKLMVANPQVNQGAALIITSLANAKRLGIPAGACVHFIGGASAEEPRDYLQRDQFVESYAQNAVLRTVMDIVDGDGTRFDAIELYSCFPVVPKMARRTLGFGKDVQPTVTGGLTFFGAPLNSYMTHAACAMVRRARDGVQRGLLYGQGGFVTKHHALVLSPEQPDESLSESVSVQAIADLKRKPAPRYDEQPSGKGTVESFTVIYDRDGSAKHGVVILRTEANDRTLARVPAEDKATLKRLLELDRTPIGTVGTIRKAADDVAEWRTA
jgi:acetyl-CoA C-acetyltransferase